MVEVSGAAVLADGGAAAVAAPVANFFAGDPAGTGGARVAAKDVGGAAIVTGSGAGGPGVVGVYRAGGAFTLDPFPGATGDGIYVGDAFLSPLSPWGEGGK